MDIPSSLCGLRPTSGRPEAAQAGPASVYINAYIDIYIDGYRDCNRFARCRHEGFHGVEPDAAGPRIVAKGRRSHRWSSATRPVPRGTGWQKFRGGFCSGESEYARVHAPTGSMKETVRGTEEIVPRMRRRRETILARQEGLEPPTSGLEGPCSIQLSYCRATPEAVRAPHFTLLRTVWAAGGRRPGWRPLLPLCPRAWRPTARPHLSCSG